MYLLREYVLKDQPTIDLTAKFLRKLVQEDKDTKRLMTDLFIMMLQGKDFTNETRGLVEWSIRLWLNNEELGQK